MDRNTLIDLIERWLRNPAGHESWMEGHPDSPDPTRPGGYSRPTYRASTLADAILAALSAERKAPPAATPTGALPQDRIAEIRDTVELGGWCGQGTMRQLLDAHDALAAEVARLQRDGAVAIVACHAERDAALSEVEQLRRERLCAARPDAAFVALVRRMWAAMPQVILFNEQQQLRDDVDAWIEKHDAPEVGDAESTPDPGA